MSNIEWTDATWNPVVGCTPVSPGCLNCYAATMANRLHHMGRHEYVGLTVRKGHIDTPDGMQGGRQVFNGTVRCLPDRLAIPLHWKKPRMIFANSMSDLFHEAVPFEFIDKVFAVMALCPRHTMQILTKRPERMAEYLSTPHWEIGTSPSAGIPQSFSRHDWIRTVAKYMSPEDRWEHLPDVDEWPLPNVWLGTSVEDQARADERIPHLLKCPAAVRFLSCEPLLGPLDLASAVVKRRIGDPQPNWVIVGGESGANARPCNVAWIRSIVAQCKAAVVPVFVKQLGARPTEVGCGDLMPMAWTWDDGGEQVERWYKPRDRKGGDMAEWSEDLRVRQMPESRP